MVNNPPANAGDVGLIPGSGRSPGVGSFPFFRDFFLMWIIFKVFIEFVTLLLPFYVLVFWSQSIRDLSSPTEDQSCTPCVTKS